MSYKTSEIMSILRNVVSQDQKWILDNLLFLHVSGSRLYGMNNDDSDYDVRGIVIAPKEFWVASHQFEQFQCKIDNLKIDFVIYDFRKWLKLALDVNPNVVESLYVESDNPNVVHESIYWQRIRSIARSLVSRKGYHGFKGYTESQIQKMIVKHGNKTGRQDLVKNFGFDTKFASHGFRLARQGYELLATGDITFPRPDAWLLKDIKYGKIYGPEDMDECAKELRHEADLLKEARDNSVLPLEPNYEVYNQLLISVFDTYVNSNRKINEKI